MNATHIERFNNGYVPVTESGCWIWVGGLFKSGYGRFSADNKDYRAHRISWSINRGQIPSGLHVLHKCDTPSCVNPDHLFLGTHSDNMQDMARKGRYVVRYGTEHHAHKLTEHDVIDIRSSGLSQRELARIYGVNQSTIGRIKLRIFWKSAK